MAQSFARGKWSHSGGTGTINITGSIDLGSAANLVDAGSGSATITGVVNGTATDGMGLVQGLIGDYFNLTAAQDLIQPADTGNSAWLGNQTPRDRPLAGPIDFPDIADNGFADSVGDPAYYNLGGGNNDNVEARWYGDIMIPGTGNAPVPINFATTSDDGSMLYIDGNAVVNNNNFQAATQATGIANLTPGLHGIDVEYYQGGGGATMDLQWDPTGGTNFIDIPNSAFFSTQAVNGLKMTGNGTLTLTNTNTYSGSTTIDAGTLVVTANGAMGPATAAGIVVNAGGALAFAGGVHYTTAEPITISGSGPAGNGAIENISGTNALVAPITLSGTAAIGSDAGTLTLGGNISTGSSTLTLVGAGATRSMATSFARAGVYSGGQRRRRHRREYQPGLGGQPLGFQFRSGHDYRCDQRHRNLGKRSGTHRSLFQPCRRTGPDPAGGAREFRLAGQSDSRRDRTTGRPH